MCSTFKSSQINRGECDPTADIEGAHLSTRMRSPPNTHIVGTDDTWLLLALHLPLFLFPCFFTNLYLPWEKLVLIQLMHHSISVIFFCCSKEVLFVLLPSAIAFRVKRIRPIDAARVWTRSRSKTTERDVRDDLSYPSDPSNTTPFLFLFLFFEVTAGGGAALMH